MKEKNANALFEVAFLRATVPTCIRDSVIPSLRAHVLSCQRKSVYIARPHARTSPRPHVATSPSFLVLQLKTITYLCTNSLADEIWRCNLPGIEL